MTLEQEIREAEAKGIAIGKAEGKAEGKMEDKLETAEEMLREGLTSKVIQRCTKLTSEQIQAIAEQIGIKLVE